jgi:hypothetical protein
MTKISDLAEKFCQAEEELDATDAVSYGTRLDGLVRRLATDVAQHVGGEYAMGEVPALMARCHAVLQWLAAEAEDVGDRQRRLGRRQAVVSLLLLCEGIRRFHAGRRKQEDQDALRALVGSALTPLVPGEE